MASKFIINLADSGFCGGVKRADEILSKIREEESQEIYILGQLIHNSIYNNLLKEKNILTINSIEEAKDKIVVIRTHGISPQEESKLNKMAKKVYDLTCPLVKSIQEKAKNYSDKNYFIIIIGNKNHAEILGIQGYIKNFTVIEFLEEVSSLNLENQDKIVVLSQSTFSQDDFINIVDHLKKKKENIEIENTLCYAPTDRQNEMTTFAKENDTIIIVGGKNSSNTKELFKKALLESESKQVFHIEKPEEIKNLNLINSKYIGIASGTSTPFFVIQECVDLLKSYSL